MCWFQKLVLSFRLLFLQTETNKERSWTVLFSSLIFLLLFDFALSFPLIWFILPTLGQLDTLLQGCSHWRQVSHYLLSVNHMFIYSTWPSSCCCLCVIKDKTLIEEGSLFSSFLEYDNKQMEEEWHLTNSVEANPANRLALQMLYVRDGSMDFPLYRSPSLGNRKIRCKNQKPSLCC